MISSASCITVISVGIAEVDRLGEVGVEQPDDPLDQVGDVAEAAGLLALAVDGDRLAAQGLLHEIGQDPAVVEPHPAGRRC